MESLTEQGAAIEMIRCVKSRHTNLAISSLKAIGNVRVAETPLMMEVEVKNFSNEAVSYTHLTLPTKA